MIKSRIRYFDKELQKIIEKDEPIPTKNKERIDYLLKINAAYEVKEEKEPKASAEK